MRYGRLEYRGPSRQLFCRPGCTHHRRNPGVGGMPCAFCVCDREIHTSYIGHPQEQADHRQTGHRQAGHRQLHRLHAHHGFVEFLGLLLRLPNTNRRIRSTLRLNFAPDVHDLDRQMSVS